MKKQHDMNYPLLNDHTREVQCLENLVEYHKLQYVEMSDSAYIWIPLWQNKKQKQLQSQKQGKFEETIFPSDCCKSFLTNLRFQEQHNKIGKKYFPSYNIDFLFE